jgi:hypothetical protein
MTHGASSGRPALGAERREPGRDERELFDALLGDIERRRRVARGRLDELARQRAALPPHERRLARESLRSQAAEIGTELARLRLADSMARVLLNHSRQPHLFPPGS